MNIAIILNFNDFNNCISLINCIKNYSIFDHIVIVDNFSTDDSFDRLVNYSSDKVRVIKSDFNGGYGYGNNFGVRYAAKEFSRIDTLTIMNPDILIEESTVKEMIRYIKSNMDVALVSPIMYLPNRKIFQNQFWSIPTKKSILSEITYFQKKINPPKKNEQILEDGNLQVGSISGPCLCFNYDKFVETGMYDERMFLYWEENYISLQIESHGWKSIILTDYSYLHNHSESIKKNVGSELKRMRFFYDSREKFFINNFQPNCRERALFKVLAFINRVEFFILNFIRSRR